MLKKLVLQPTILKKISNFEGKDYQINAEIVLPFPQQTCTTLRKIP